MTTIKEQEQKIISDFEMFDDWMDKYNYIIELGKSIPPIKEEYKTDKYLIKGCQSRVWLHADYRDGKVIYTADSDALITKGIAALLIEVLSGQPPKDIVEAELSFIDEIGLKEHLSQTRSNGLVNMIKQMKLYALAFQKM
ncbi:MAG: SufE family protein [Bacteroidales bacterium]